MKAIWNAGFDMFRDASGVQMDEKVNGSMRQARCAAVEDRLKPNGPLPAF